VRAARHQAPRWPGTTTGWSSHCTTARASWSA
jgi:hypothetical protein